MEQRLKQRLVGAVVLVALAVIFIPMLLQGPVEREPTDVPIEIPPKPAMAVVAQPGSDAQAGAPAVSAPFTPSAPVDAPIQAAADAGAPAPAPATPAPAPQPSSQPTHGGAETAARAPTDLAAWAVQVGSFGDEANAMGLRDTLRGKGYSAYVESVKSEGKTFYRVRVGPTAQREQAEALQAALTKKESLKGLVVPHP